MSKRGQVTIFIILAIVIVASTILFFSFKDTITQKAGGFSGSNAVKEYVDECILSVSEEVVYAVGNGGGSFFSPANSDELGFSYYQLGGENYFPSLEDFENEINLFVAMNLIFCLNNFENFPDLNISGGKMEVISEILNDSVRVVVDYPLSIKKGEEIIRYESFEEAVIPVRLGEMHFVMDSLIKNDYYAEDGVCISCMVDVAYLHGFVFEQINYEGNDLFILEDLENEKIEKPYKFVFVNRRENEA